MTMFPLRKGFRVTLCVRTAFESFPKVTIEQLCYPKMKNVKIPIYIVGC
jgi:hypothetical protein